MNAFFWEGRQYIGFDYWQLSLWLQLVLMFLICLYAAFLLSLNNRDMPRGRWQTAAT